MFPEGKKAVGKEQGKWIGFLLQSEIHIMYNKRKKEKKEYEKVYRS